MEKLLLPTDIARIISPTGAVAYRDPNDIESETKVESVLPDGWDVEVDRDGSLTYVNTETDEIQKQRPTRATRWNVLNF